LYAGLDAALAEKLAQTEDVLARPLSDFPLTAVLDYQRVDGARLTLYANGLTVAQNSLGQTFTNTITSTQAISLTSDLVSSGIVRTGLNTFQGNVSTIITNTEGVTLTVTATPKPPRTLLLVRGPGGVYDGEWFNTADVTELGALNALLDQMLGLAALPEGVETPTGVETGTPATPDSADQTTTPEATAVTAEATAVTTPPSP